MTAASIGNAVTANVTPGRVKAVSIIAAIGGCLLSWFLVSRGPYLLYSDLPVYTGYAHDVLVRGLVPYRDFPVAYPPLALPVFLLPSLIAGGSASGYQHVFGLEMAFCGVLTVGLAALVVSSRPAPRQRAAFAVALLALAPLFLGGLLVTRYDLFPTMLLVAGLAAVWFERTNTGFVLLGLATAAKGFPIVAFPLVALYVWRTGGRRKAIWGIASFCGIVLASLLPFFILAPRGLWQSFYGQASRPPEIESLAAAALLAAHQMIGVPVSVYYTHTSQSLAGAPALQVASFLSLLQVGGVVVAFVGFARGPATKERLLTAAAAAVCAFIAFDRVFSPQFLIWLVPLVAMVGGRRGSVAMLMLVYAMRITQIWYPQHFQQLDGLAPLESWAVVARDLVIVALLGLLAGVSAAHLSGVSSRLRRIADDRLAVVSLVIATGALALIFAEFIGRPLWFDEWSRAYQIALPGLHMGLGNSYAPLSLGWLLVEKAAIHLLSTTEVVLRLPQLIAWLLLGPACYALARKLMPRLIAFIVAASLVCNPAVVYYGTQLKPYVVEALATVLILLLWGRARMSEGWLGRLGWYGAITIVALFSVPSPFVIVPLFALDLVDALGTHRGSIRTLGKRLSAPLAAGGAVLAYTVGFVLSQNFAAGYVNWQPYYAPHTAAGLWNFIVANEPTYLTGAVTGIPEFDTKVIALPGTGPLLAEAIGLTLLVLIPLGIWRLRRHALGRGVIVAAVGGLCLQLVASLGHKWPFGLARVDLFYVPLLYLLAGAGVASLAQHARRGRPLQWTAEILIAASIATGAVAEAHNLRTEHDLLQQTHIVKPMGAVRSLVAAARREYRPGTMAYVWLDGQYHYGPHGKGWIFYMYDYAWPRQTRLAARVPLADTYFAGSWPSPNDQLANYLARHRHTARLLVVGVSGMAPFLSNAGFRMSWERSYPRTGLLMVWVRRPAPAPSSQLRQ